MARPTKYTPETADRIVSFITAGANREDAAQACGVCRETLTRWLQSKPEFFTRVMEADSTAAIVAERGVYKKDPKAWLQAKRPKVWGRNAIEISGPDGGPIEHREVLDEEAVLAKAAEIAAKRSAL